MSGGRVELGLGAGWYEAEHARLRHPLPGTGERFDRLEEQLAIVTGLWATPAGETFDYAGEHYRLTRLPRAAEAGAAAAAAGHHRRHGQEAHAGRSPRATPTSSTCRSTSVETLADAVRAGRRGLRRRRPRPGRRWCCSTPSCSASAATRPSSPAAPPRSAARSTSSAPNGRRRHPAGGRSTGSGEYADAGVDPRLPAGPRPRRPRPPRPRRRRDPPPPPPLPPTRHLSSIFSGVSSQKCRLGLRWRGSR